MTRHFTIYCVTNKVNGKRYIGQTCRTVEARWTTHVASAKRGDGCRILGAAIRKYGEAQFAHEALEIVATRADANAAEARWIADQQTRLPHGYNLAAGGNAGDVHEDSKKRIAESQKKFWEQFSREEKAQRVRHQMAGMSPARKSERVRKAWSGMPAEAREARVRKAGAAIATAKSGNVAHSAQMSAWQSAQAKLRTPEQRRAMVMKAWETRRAKYGRDGVKRAKTSEEYSSGSKKGWANMSPEARAERVRKVQEGRFRAREARISKLVHINFLRAA